MRFLADAQWKIRRKLPIPPQKCDWRWRIQRTSVPGGPPGPTRTAHVARSLRDREWAWNNAVCRPFPQISNRYRDLPKATQSGGMERSECESRRDSPTWLGLSETENGHGITPYVDHSHRSRTGIETCRNLPNPAAWAGRTEWHSVPHVGPVRRPGPELPLTPNFSPAIGQERPGVDKPTRLQVPAGRQDLQEQPTWLGLSKTENGRGTTPCASHSHRYRTGIETCRELPNPAAWPGRTEWHSVPHVGPVRRPGPELPLTPNFSPAIGQERRGI